MNKLNVPIACDLTALADRKRHEAVGAELLPQAFSVTALDDGYQIEFPSNALMLVAEFIDAERRCCPFFQLEIRVMGAAETLRLRLTGGDGVKAFLERELLPLLPISFG